MAGAVFHGIAVRTAFVADDFMDDLLTNHELSNNDVSSGLSYSENRHEPYRSFRAMNSFSITPVRISTLSSLRILMHSS